MKITLDYSSLDDRSLVELHLAGDWLAFRQIVERHQGMVCALGVSACGDVGRSEDLAQEVFVAAWKQLPSLREPQKLRAWLAGIARNQIHNSLRRQQRVPTARAEPLSVETPAAGAGPREHAVNADEVALMWRALESIPETYREPMVLFYREQHSVPAVAAALEISEDTVRQRLVRGRAMLTERMAALVEEALERSAPTPAFAGVVMLALPTGTTIWLAEAAAGEGGTVARTALTAGGLAATAAKGGLAVKGLAVLGLVPALLQGGLEFFRFRTRFEASASPAERRRIAVAHLAPNLRSAGLLASIGLFVFVLPELSSGRLSGPAKIGCMALGLTVAITASHWVVRRWVKNAGQAGADAEATPATEATMGAEGFEYRSRSGWLGLPWVHVCFPGAAARSRPSACGWIAVSNGVAFGGFFACGAKVAVAPVSVGFCACGLLSLGVVGVAVGMIGALAVGGWSHGAAVALGWQAAWARTYAGAGEYAQGFFASAAHANDAVAAEFFNGSGFFRAAALVWELAMGMLWFMWLPGLLLMSGYLWRSRPAAKS